MNISNYIPISRKLFEHHLWSESREYSRFEAWLDLLQLAKFEDAKMYIGNKVITVKRGNILASLRFLAKRWQWSDKKVRGFLSLLEIDGMIKRITDSDAGQTLLSICNYDRYNFTRQITDAAETREKHRTDANNNNVNNTNVYNNSYGTSEKILTASLVTDFSIQTKWLGDVATKYHISPDNVIEYLKKFEVHLRTKLIDKQSVYEFSSHFLNWLRIQLKVHSTAKYQKQTNSKLELNAQIAGSVLDKIERGEL